MSGSDCSAEYQVMFSAQKVRIEILETVVGFSERVVVSTLETLMTFRYTQRRMREQALSRRLDLFQFASRGNVISSGYWLPTPYYDVFPDVYCAHARACCHDD